MALPKNNRRSIKSILPEIEFPITKQPEGSDPSELIFPEWSDDDIIEKTPLRARTSKHKVVTDDETPFEDPQIIVLPKVIEVTSWKRPSEVFFNNEIVIFEDKPGISDLTVGSTHLLHSEFIRNFISCMTLLEYMGANKPWTIEGVSDTFTPLTQSEQWKAWHHVYSAIPDKTNEKQKFHRPKVNKAGKYAIRLFWLGAWRKIYVDDKIPVNRQNVPVLPCFEVDIGQFYEAQPQPLPKVSNSSVVGSDTSVTNKKDAKKSTKDSKSSKESKKSSSVKERSSISKKKVELWPFLVVKAVLKIGMLSRIGNNELVDYSMTHLFTGWVPILMRINEYMDVNTLWDIFSEYVDNYKWPDEEGLKGSKSIVYDDEKKDKNATKAAKNEDDNVDDGDGNKKIALETMKGTISFAQCQDMRLNNCQELSPLAPCWGHFFFINQTRNIPLVKPPNFEPLPLWKKFRWEKWAIEKGIYDPPCLSEQQKRYLHIVSPFKQNTSYKQYMSTTDLLLKSPSDYISDNLMGRILGSEIVKIREKSVIEQSSVVVGTRSFNPVWVPFDKLAPHLNGLYVFYKPSGVKFHMKISDLKQRKPASNTTTTTKKPPNVPAAQSGNSFTFVQWSKEMSDTRNSPLYVYIDSLNYKTFVVNFSHAGATDIFSDKFLRKSNNDLPSQKTNNSISNKQTDSKSLGTGSNHGNVSDTSTLVILQRFKQTQSTLTSTTHMKDDSDSDVEERQFVGKIANVLIKHMDISHKGKLTTNISTYGNKSKLIYLEPGRHVLEIWINSETSYVLNLMSDTVMGVGCLEEILEHIQNESETLKFLCNNVCNNFGKIIQEFGTANFLAELRNFYASYKPSKVTLVKKDLITLHNAFFEEFLNLIFYNVSEDEKKSFGDALSVLFVDPNIPRKKKIVSTEQSNADFSNLPDEFKTIFLEMMKLALLIQKLYKGNKVMTLRAKHNPEHNGHIQTLDILKTIYKKFFSSNVRTEYCTILIRKLLSRSDMSEISKKYDFYYDLDSVMDVRCLSGIVQVTSENWVPITRCIFYIKKSPVTITIHLFCPLTNYFVRVFNNDDNKEIERNVNNVNRWVYAQNLCGYTLVAYGWANGQKVIPWKLSFVSKRNYKETFYIVQDNLQGEIFKGYYLPTIDNIMCKYQIRVSQNTVISLRLSTSYEHVQFRITIKNANDEIVNEIIGKENVIIPVTILSVNDTNRVDVQSANSSKISGEISDEFLLEVQILDGTWPLKVTEWQTVRKELIKKYLFSECWSADVNKKEKPGSKEAHTTPTYSLQVLYRASDTVQILKITQKEDELMEFKKQIFVDKNRFYKGKELRDEFIMNKFPRCGEVAEPYENTSALSLSYNNSVELLSFMYNCSLLFNNEFHAARSPNNPFSYTHFITTSIYDDIPKDRLIVSEEGETILKTQEEKDADEMKRLQENEFIEDQQNALEDNLKNKLTSHLERYSLLDFWFSKVLEENEKNLLQAYESRDRYVKYVAESEAPLPGDGAPEKASNKKKDKKKKK